MPNPISAPESIVQEPPIPAGLGPEHAARFKALQERKAAAQAQRALREQSASMPPSPEEILRAEEEEVARLEREERDQEAWKSLRAKHGKGRVALIQTPMGAIIMRVQTLAEQDAGGQRINALENETDRLSVVRETTLDCVVYPSREDARKVTDAFPGLWVRLFQARDALSVGESERLTGKA